MDKRRVTAIVRAWLWAMAMMLVPAAVHGKTTFAEVEVAPSPLTMVDGGQPQQAVVVVRNVGTDVLRDLKLSWIPEPALTVAAQPATVPALSPSGEAAWTVTIGAPALQALPAALQFRVDFTRGTQSSGATSHVVLAPLTLRASDPSATEALAEVQIKTTLESLSEHRGGKIHLIVTNKSPFQISVDPVTANAPVFICFPATGGKTCPSEGAPGSTPPLTLSPRETGTVGLDVKARGRVVPGKHLIVFSVPVRWKVVEHEYRRTIVAAQEVPVAVIGESEILKALGVPSFLLLPGFLFLLTFRFLWTVRGEKLEIERFSLAVDKPEFWLLAITASGIMAFAYPRLTGHSYLEGYDLGDIATVWLLSVGLGAVTWFIGAVGLVSYRAYLERQRTPGTNDREIDLLQKLQRQGLHLDLPRVRFTDKGKDLVAFLLQPPDDARPTSWVGPGVVINVHAAGDDLQAKIEREVETARTGSLEPLIETLNATRKVKLSWKRGAFPKQPRLMKKEDLTADGADTFVEIGRGE